MFHSVVLIPRWKNKNIGKICADPSSTITVVWPQPASTPHTHSLFPSQDGERIRRINMRTVDWDGDILGGKAEAVLNQTKEFIHPFSLAGRSLFCLMVTWEDKLHLWEHSPALYSEHDAMWNGYPSGLLGSAVQAVSPPIFLCIPSLLGDGEGWGAERLWLCVSSVQQWLKHPCVVSPISITEHSPTLATGKGINCSQEQHTHITEKHVPDPS